MSLAASSTPLVPLEDIKEARRRISNVVVHTPLVPLRPRPGNSNDEKMSADIFLKLETAQPCNSFKIRGIYNAVSLLSDEERKRGLSTVSAGNTAQAIAWCARHYQTSARSLMPDHAPKTKIDAVTSLGATPVLRPVDEVFHYMKTAGWKHEPYSFIHPWTNPNVMRGHGSMGLEIVEDCPEVDTVYIPVGGGGLISGVGAALKHLRPNVKVIAVEPEGCPALHRSFELGRPAEVECDTSCDGVAVPYITEEMWPFIRTVVDEVVLVSELEVESGIRRLAATNKLTVEPSAALSVAAALKHREGRRQTVVDEVVLVSELDVESGIQRLAATNKLIVEPSTALKHREGDRQTVVDEVVLVSELEVESGIRRLAATNKLIVEPSAALSVAAALKHREERRQCGKCVCVITGGSIDMEKFVAILSKL